MVRPAWHLTQETRDVTVAIIVPFFGERFRELGAQLLALKDSILLSNAFNRLEPSRLGERPQYHAESVYLPPGHRL